MAFEKIPFFQSVVHGTEGRNRTDTVLPPLDFESSEGLMNFKSIAHRHRTFSGVSREKSGLAPTLSISNLKRLLYGKTERFKKAV